MTTYSSIAKTLSALTVLLSMTISCVDASASGRNIFAPPTLNLGDLPANDSLWDTDSPLSDPGSPIEFFEVRRVSFEGHSRDSSESSFNFGAEPERSCLKNPLPAGAARYRKPLPSPRLQSAQERDVYESNFLSSAERKARQKERDIAELKSFSLRKQISVRDVQTNNINTKFFVTPSNPDGRVTIRDVKNKISSEYGIPFEAQDLIFNRKRLNLDQNESTCAGLGITSESTIHFSDRRIAKMHRADKLPVKVNYKPNMGIQLKPSPCGWVITKIESTPGQPGLAVGNLIVGIAGESFLGKTRAQQQELFKKHLEHRAELSVMPTPISFKKQMEILMGL